MEHRARTERIQRLVSAGAVVMSTATLSACVDQEASCGTTIRTDESRFTERYLSAEDGGVLAVSYDRKSDKVLIGMHGEKTRLAVDSLPAVLEMGHTTLVVTLDGDTVSVDC